LVISHEVILKDKISAMIEAAIGGDVLTDDGGGFVSIMGKSSPSIRQDIPAAFEAYTLLSHFLGRLPVRSVVLDATNPISDLSPGILHDAIAARLVALLPIGAGELTAVAYWLTDSMRSNQVKQMAGVLALPFSIENHAGVELLLPEWFVAFYVHGDPDHCIPILALRSVLADQRFGGDWVAIALERMTAFALPQEQAASAMRMAGVL
jgi:hypothetical protein